ncbi:MAG: hypothetical protein FWD34_02460 [Oscillospiraceae bacterium]|nr:hypothetical protein [Oscillospiraceae bacterium]
MKKLLVLAVLMLFAFSSFSIVFLSAVHTGHACFEACIICRFIKQKEPFFKDVSAVSCAIVIISMPLLVIMVYNPFRILPSSLVKNCVRLNN